MTDNQLRSARIHFVWKIVAAAIVIGLSIVAIQEGPQLFENKPPSAEPVSQPPAPGDVYAQTLSRVHELIALQTAGVAEVATPSMPLADLGIDRLTLLDLTSALESEFYIKLSDKELQQLRTVEDLAKLVASKRNGKSPEE